MIDLQLLGGLDLVGPDLSPTARARRRHPLMLLALVATAAPQGMSRERVMAFLWPESDAARASNSLRQVLHAIRRDVADDLFLPETSGAIQLDPAKVNVDLWAFRDAITRKAYAEVISAHRGPFLSGFQISGVAEFTRWVETERAIVEREYVASLDALARQAEDAGQFDEAVAWRRRQAEAEPFSSRAALGLLKALSGAGDRPGALAYAAVYESFVKAHLEVPPDPTVLEFVAALRRSTPPGRGSVGAKSSAEFIAVESAAMVVTPADGVPVSAMPRSRRITTGSRWIIAAGLAFGLVGIGAGYSFSAGVMAGDRVLVLASGELTDAGRDTANLIVACDGPACPTGGLPQPGFVVPTHVAYSPPPTNSFFIAGAPDGTTIDGTGYACCSLVTFERKFSLPPDAATATISISVLADNQARVMINGREFGRQADSLSQSNFGAAAATFATTFLPDPSGTNRLRVTLWDGGGVGALNFRAFVAHDRARKSSPDSGR